MVIWLISIVVAWSSQWFNVLHSIWSTSTSLLKVQGFQMHLLNTHKLWWITICNIWLYIVMTDFHNSFIFLLLCSKLFCASQINNWKFLKEVVYLRSLVQNITELYIIMFYWIECWLSRVSFTFLWKRRYWYKFLTILHPN